MSLLTPRATYAPFEYQEAYNFWELQQQGHWLPGEVSINSDVNDWKSNLTAGEKNIIGHILKGFTQSEIFIQDYWSNQVARTFRKPEIQMMAAAFAGMESIHAVSYALLNQTLNLEDYGAFMHDPSTKAKIDRLIETKGKSKHDIAMSLAVFSAFNEGVNLFSSFAILLNFSRFNKLKGVGQIIAFSVKDESLHSDAGCWLFRTMMGEYPEVWTDDFKKELYDAARLTVQLEDTYIDKAFEMGDVEGLTAHDLKQYIRFRTNLKLSDINLKSNWKNLDVAAVKRITDWFEPMTSGVEMQDFFAGRVSAYSKSVVSFDNVWNNYREKIKNA
jgi:ribonucleoside-diphosphate reductase beta chain